MSDWLKQALEWLKTPAHYFLPLLAASSFGLFAPLDLLEFLGVNSWRAEGKFYLGSVFIISAATTGCHYISEIIKLLSGKYRVFLSERSAKSRLKKLTAEEKRFLAWYLENNTRIQRRWMHDSVAAVLLSERIIYVAVAQGMKDNFPFTIDPWVWDYLHKNPHLVDVCLDHKKNE